MRNTLGYGIGALAVLLAIGGCGGGSSSDSVTTGTATYLDSAVSGIHYVCGSQSGETDENGSFTFEVGKGCTFYLNEMQLKSISNEELFDGAQFVEDTVTIGQLLQTLDTDGNASNGITITPEVIQALANNNITELPDTDAEFEALYQLLDAAVDDYNGTAITEEAARDHMDETMGSVLTEMLAGNTFYVPGEENGASILTQATINEDATHIQGKRLIGPDAGSVNESIMSISGNTLIIGDANFEIDYVGSMEAYLKMDEQQDEGVYHARWYHDKVEAEAYLNIEPSVYSNASLQGVWVEATTFGNTRVYTILDGAGVVTEFRAFRFPSPAGTYSVDVDGNVEMTIHPDENTTITGQGEMVSASEFTVTFPVGDSEFVMTFVKVTNLAACAGTWSVTVDGILNGNTNTPPTSSFSVTVDNNGGVTGMTGFAAPTSGRFFCEGETMVAHVFTGEPEDSQYPEMTFYGTVSGGTINGFATIDNSSEDDPDLQLTFTRN
jgi:hypothetical protein